MLPKFVPRERKQKHRAKESQPQVDSNVLEILPVPKDEKEVRREELREEFRAQYPKVSAKKQKRLDKYIVRHYLLPSVNSCANWVHRKTS